MRRLETKNTVKSFYLLSYSKIHKILQNEKQNIFKFLVKSNRQKIAITDNENGILICRSLSRTSLFPKCLHQWLNSTTGQPESSRKFKIKTPKV